MIYTEQLPFLWHRLLFPLLFVWLREIEKWKTLSEAAAALLRGQRRNRQADRKMRWEFRALIFSDYVAICYYVRMYAPFGH